MGFARILWEARGWDTITEGGTADSGFPVANIGDWRDYEIWQDSGGNSYTITVDAGAGNDVSANSWAVAGHNLNTVGARIKLDAATQAAPAVFNAVHAYFTPGNDFVQAKYFTQESNRLWRMTIDNNGGAAFVPQIGIYFVGNYLEFPELIEFPFDPDRQRDFSSRQKGGEGDLLGVTNDFTERAIAPTFRFLTQSWVTNSWLPFWSSHRLNPFFFAWDHENFADEVYLQAFDMREMTVPYDRVWRMPLSLNIIGVLEE